MDVIATIASIPINNLAFKLMAITAEMALEDPASLPRREQVVLCNVELNNRCAFTAACGPRCYLNQVHVDRAPLSEKKIGDCVAAMLRRGDVIRHVAIVGKEALESPLLLLRIARAFHAAPSSTRPASLGVISASAPGIRRWLPLFRDTPLSWLAISIDVEGLGFRAGDKFQVLDAAIEGKAAGGTSALAVNTIFTETTADSVVALADRLRKARLDQWTLCPFVTPQQGIMRPSVTPGAMEKMIGRAGDVLDVASRVVVETEPSLMREILGPETWQKLETRAWRIEYCLPNGVWFFARTSQPGYFLRQRFDGALLSRDDFSHIGLLKGRYGSFDCSTDIDRALQLMEIERADFARQARRFEHPIAIAA